MNIDLNGDELYEILKNKYGEACFRLFFSENKKGFELRTGKKIGELKEAPHFNNVVIGLDNEKIVIDN